MESSRLAVEGDLEVLAGLWDRAVGELEGQRGGALLAGALERPDVSGFLAAYLGDPDRALALGMIDSVPVGIASAVADRQRPVPIGSLEMIYVERDARQVGVAEAMVDTIVNWCRRLGLAGLDAPALPGNRAAKAFFEDNGFLARLIIMHREVQVEDRTGVESGDPPA